MKKWTKNPWGLGIGKNVIGGVLLSLVIDWIYGVNWFSTIKIAVKFLST